MTISEQNKQEAEKVMEMYLPMTYQNTLGATHSAIQDRKSVLEALIKVAYLPAITDHKLKKELDNINEQVEYLKSKI